MSEDIERDPLLRLWALLFFLLKVPYSIAGTVVAYQIAGMVAYQTAVIVTYQIAVMVAYQKAVMVAYQTAVMVA